MRAIGHLDADCFYVSAERVRREVALSKCPVSSWTVKSLGDDNKLSKDSFREGELLELSVRERMPGDVLWKEEPDRLGVIDADRMYAHVILPPHAFAPMWSAAEATDGRRRSVELELKARHPEILSVTNVGFFEAMRSLIFRKKIVLRTYTVDSDLINQ